MSMVGRRPAPRPRRGGPIPGPAPDICGKFPLFLGSPARADPAGWPLARIRPIGLAPQPLISFHPRNSWRRPARRRVSEPPKYRKKVERPHPFGPPGPGDPLKARLSEGARAKGNCNGDTILKGIPKGIMKIMNFELKNRYFFSK